MRQVATDKSEFVPDGLDPDESPYEVQAIAGLPFHKNSEEAKAIREVIEQADRERAAAEDRRGSR